MMAASTPRQAQVRIIAPAFCAISGSKQGEQEPGGSAVMRRYYSQEAKS
jgi:hypothetical protein